MRSTWIHTVGLTVAAITTCSCHSTQNSGYEFPEGFLFGVATAAYQIEGGWNADGKGQSIWDVFTHEHPDQIKDHTTGDVADDSFDAHQRDVAELKYLGVDFYRFSISWPRILPTGFIDKPNTAGIRYYNTLINELLDSNIEPVVTMYHWDLPEPLQLLGGWANSKLVDYFEDYAYFLFKTFGKKVKRWITFNEPEQFCTFGYGMGIGAPGVNSPGVGNYLCAHTVLLAHAKAYKLYDIKFRQKQEGEVGITISARWYEPATISTADIEATERCRQFNFALYAHPIFSKDGDYPAIVRKTVAAKSKQQGLRRSRLPSFTPQELEELRGSADFYGLNHYTTSYISANNLPDFKKPSFQDDVRVRMYADPSWPSSTSDWLKVVPWGMRKILNWLRDEYGDIPILITENGISTAEGLHDVQRIFYIKSYLRNLLEAYNDGVNVIGYTYWSLMDNMEWIQGYTGSCYSTKKSKYKFPERFIFGTATASYQIEGGWNEDGKGESIWDVFTHKFPYKIKDGSNGDVATDSYHAFRCDVQNLKYLGVDFYRFSISWPRVLPTGMIDKPNPAGIHYYNMLIDELLKSNIEPVVTMYHWDLPEPLQQLGGWPNRMLAQYFEDYADFLFKNFGGKVKKWITFNEPDPFCRFGYGTGYHAPGMNSSGIGHYLCAHTVLLAHAKAYRLYENKYKQKHKGQIGITLHSMWYEPATKSIADRKATERCRQFQTGLYAHPIFSMDGNYPAIVRTTVEAKSRKQGFRRSRLPTFTPQELEDLRGSADFYGLNHYTTNYVSASKVPQFDKPSFDDDIGVRTYTDPSWPSSGSSWLKVVPWGLRKLLNWLRDEYINIPILITENGISTPQGSHDAQRIFYIKSYLRNLLDAYNDGVNVVGYTYWSLIDNMEWREGYTERFGLFEVDFNSPNRTRMPRDSVDYYRNVIQTRLLEPTEDDVERCNIR